MSNDNKNSSKEVLELNDQLHRKDMKIAALTERISQIVAEYENKVADLRVEYTSLANLVNQSAEESADQ